MMIIGNNNNDNNTTMRYKSKNKSVPLFYLDIIENLCFLGFNLIVIYVKEKLNI